MPDVRVEVESYEVPERGKWDTGALKGCLVLATCYNLPSGLPAGAVAEVEDQPRSFRVAFDHHQPGLLVLVFEGDPAQLDLCPPAAAHFITVRVPEPTLGAPLTPLTTREQAA